MMGTLRVTPALTFAALCLLWGSEPVHGDGGSVVAVREIEGARVTVLVSPMPVRVGEVEVSVLVIDGSGKPFPHVSVQVSASMDDGFASQSVAASPDQSRNSLLQTALIDCPREGNWNFAIRVEGDGVAGAANMSLPVLPAAAPWIHYLPWVLPVLPMLALLIWRESALRRRQARMALTRSGSAVAICLLMVVLATACNDAAPVSAPLPSPAPASEPVPAAGADPNYSLREPSADGIGKFFCGREIAQVMGHEAAEWLERPERAGEEGTRLLLPMLKLQSNDLVADIGAGGGYYSFPIAKLVPGGAVYAVDIQQEMLDIIAARSADERVPNIVPWLGAVDDSRLPANAFDLALLVDSYHEFSHPFEMLRSIANALKPDGVLVLVEYRAEDDAVPIKPLHKMSVAQAKKELRCVGLELIELRSDMPWQHVMVFGKSRPSP